MKNSKGFLIVLALLLSAPAAVFAYTGCANYYLLQHYRIKPSTGTDSNTMQLRGDIELGASSTTVSLDAMPKYSIIKATGGASFIEVHAQRLYGDGSALTGISGGAQTLVSLSTGVTGTLQPANMSGDYTNNVKVSTAIGAKYLLQEQFSIVISSPYWEHEYPLPLPYCFPYETNIIAMEAKTWNGYCEFNIDFRAVNSEHTSGTPLWTHGVVANSTTWTTGTFDNYLVTQNYTLYIPSFTVTNDCRYVVIRGTYTKTK